MRHLPGVGRAVEGFRWMSDGQTLALSRGEGWFTLWDTLADTPRQLAPGETRFHFPQTDISPDGSWLVRGHAAWDREVDLSIWKLGPDEWDTCMPRVSTFGSPGVERLSFLPDSTGLLAELEGSIVLVRPPEWLPEGWFGTTRDPMLGRRYWCIDPIGSVVALVTPALSPAGGDMAEVLLYRIADGVQLAGWMANRWGEPLRGLALSPGGSLLAGAPAGRLQLWYTDGSVTARFPVRGVVSIAFSPDGRWLAASRSDGVVVLFEVGTFREVAAFDWQLGEMSAIEFSPDSLRCAVGGSTGDLLVWDVE